MDKISAFYLDEYERRKDRLKNRRVELEETAQKMEEWAKTNISGDIELFLSLERFDSLFKNYCHDITRYKHFHGMLDEGKEANVNFQKIYAYTAKWILREKPLYATIGDLQELKKESSQKVRDFIDFSNIVNELWLVQWIEVSYFSQRRVELNLTRQLDMSLTEKSSSSSLIYLLTFREFSVDWFEEWLNAKFPITDSETSDLI